MNDFLVRDLSNEQIKEQHEWLGDFTTYEMDILQGFASLTSGALLEKVKELEDLAYQLGIEESTEMTRGKLLNVLGTASNNLQSSEMGSNLKPATINGSANITSLF